MSNLKKFRFQNPTNIMVVGPTSSGKTMLIKDILLHRDSMFKHPPRKVVFCYTAFQPFMTEDKFSFIDFTPTLPEIDTFDPDEHSILILDDILHNLGDKRIAGTLSKLFMVDSHHKNVTVIMCVQNLFSKERVYRDLALNSHYMILFRLKRDISQIRRLGSQLMPGVKPSFTEIYNWATKEPYSYLLIDLHPSTSSDIVLRQNILPDEIETVIYGATALEKQHALNEMSKN